MDFQKIAIFTIDNYTNILRNLIWWRSGPKGTIYTRPDESPFFCPPTKNLVSSGYNHLFGVCSVFRSSTVVCNDSLHHFWLIVDENLPTSFLHCILRTFQCSLPIQHCLLAFFHKLWSIVLPNREPKFTRITIMGARGIAARMISATLATAWPKKDSFSP